MRVLNAIGIASVLATASYADIILVSPTEISGTGLGAVNTVLTLSSPANATLETGCVGWSGSATTTSGCGFANSAVQAQFGTPTLQALGIATLADLRIVFNASEPGNARDVQLNQLSLTLYAANGTPSPTFSTASPLFFPTTAAGTGNSGFVFRLDSAQAAQAQTFVNSNGGVSTVRVGLGASIGCSGANCTGAATGGLESFFVQGSATIPVEPQPEPIPEPSTLIMLGSALGLFGLWRRR